MNLDDYLKSITPATQRSSLAPFHADVLKLRASGCTLSQISDFLRMNGVTVTLSTVAKYLRKQSPQRSSASAIPPSAPPTANLAAPATPTPATAPTRSVAPPDTPASTQHDSPVAPESTASKEQPGFKSVEQLRLENPTLPAIQITKMYAQQYAGPVIDPAQLEEMKRRYNPLQIKP